MGKPGEGAQHLHLDRERLDVLGVDGRLGLGKEKLDVGREGFLDRAKQVVELLLLHLERRKMAKVLHLGKVKQAVELLLPHLERRKMVEMLHLGKVKLVEIYLREGGKENQEGEERHLVDKERQVVGYR